MPKTREESWACRFPLPLLSATRTVWRTRTGGNMIGMKSYFLLSEAASGNKLEKQPCLQENSLPCYSYTPIFFRSRNGCPRSQYRSDRSEERRVGKECRSR